MQRKPKLEYYIVILVVVCICINTISQIRQTENPFDEEKYLTPVPVTNKTGSIHPGCASFEYLPQKAFKNRSYIETRDREKVYILQGNIEVANTKKESSKLSFEINNSNTDATLELPYIYYLGYNAYLTKSDGTKEKLRVKESNNGFCMIEIPAEKQGTIEVKYTGTFLMRMSYCLTLLGIIVLFLYKKKNNILKSNKNDN